LTRPEISPPLATARRRRLRGCSDHPGTAGAGHRPLATLAPRSTVGAQHPADRHEDAHHVRLRELSTRRKRYLPGAAQHPHPGPMRSPPVVPQLPIESALDELSLTAGVDPVELRFRTTRRIESPRLPALGRSRRLASANPGRRRSDSAGPTATPGSRLGARTEPLIGDWHWPESRSGITPPCPLPRSNLPSSGREPPCAQCRPPTKQPALHYLRDPSGGPASSGWASSMSRVEIVDSDMPPAARLRALPSGRPPFVARSTTYSCACAGVPHLGPKRARGAVEKAHG